MNKNISNVANNNNTSVKEESTMNNNINSVANNEHRYSINDIWDKLHIDIPCVSIGAYDTFRNVVRIPDRCSEVNELFGLAPSWFDGHIRASIVSDPSHYCNGNAAVVFTSLDDEVRFMADVTGDDGFSPDIERVELVLRNFDLYACDRRLEDVMSDWNAYNADNINDEFTSPWDAECNKFDAIHHREISLDCAVMSFRLSGMWLMFDWAIKCLGGAEAVLNAAKSEVGLDASAHREIRPSFAYYIYSSLRDEYSKNSVSIRDLGTFIRFMSAQRDVINEDSLDQHYIDAFIVNLVSKYNKLA